MIWLGEIIDTKHRAASQRRLRFSSAHHFKLKYLSILWNLKKNLTWSSVVLRKNVCKRIIVGKWEMHCGETHMPSLVFNCYNLGKVLLLPCIIRWGVMLQHNQLKGNYFPHAMLCIKAKSVEKYLSLCLSVYPSIVTTVLCRDGNDIIQLFPPSGSHGTLVFSY